MDINKLILDTQQQAERLQRQSEQEKAMAEVLPLRFSQNLAAFKHYMPSIYEQFNDYQPVRPFRFFCNDNGIPNILWLDEQVALYGEDPFAEAKDQIRLVIDNSHLQCVNFVPQWHADGQIHIKYNNEISKLKQRHSLDGLPLHKVLATDIPLSIMYGIGLGYQLGYLYERCKIRNLFAFEPDLDMFYASLYCFDWHALLDYMDQANLCLHLFIGVEEQLLVSDMMEALHCKGAFWSAGYFSFCHYHSPAIHSLLYKVESEFYLLRSGWGFFDDNIYALAHSHLNLKEHTPFLLRQRDTRLARDVPVFVVGNGPSLDQSIEFIKAHAEQAIIIACGTAVSALHKAGIRPDIYVAVERTKSSADFLSILNADDFLKDAVFLSVDVIHPECKRFFRRSALAFKPNEPMFGLLYNQLGDTFVFDSIEYSNPFVGNTGLNYAALLGFKQVYLFGIDNGYKDAGKHHSTLSLYYDEKQETKVKNHTVGTFPARGNYGGEVLINHLFGLSIHNMASVLRDYPDLRCRNCSDGAYIEGADPVRVAELDLSSPKLDKIQLLDSLLDSCFRPFDVDSLDFSAALNVPFFHDLLDKMRSDWRDVERAQDAIMSLMQRHHDYLIYLLLSRESHIYRVLIGSINYFYANLISLILASLDEPSTVLVERLNTALDILDHFFADAMAIYADAFERHDTTYFVGLNVFKHG